MQDLYKSGKFKLNRFLIYSFIFVFLIVSVVIARVPTQDYNNALTRSIADGRYCIQEGICALNILTVNNLSVINFFNVSATIINYNVTGDLNIEGGINASNGTFEFLTVTPGGGDIVQRTMLVENKQSAVVGIQNLHQNGFNAINFYNDTGTLDMGIGCGNRNSFFKFDCYIDTKRNIRFRSDGTTVMMINRTGNVGIGTTGPKTKLQVEGNTKINGQLNVTNINVSENLSTRYFNVIDINSNRSNNITFWKDYSINDFLPSENPPQLKFYYNENNFGTSREFVMGFRREGAVVIDSLDSQFEMRALFGLYLMQLGRDNIYMFSNVTAGKTPELRHYMLLDGKQSQDYVATKLDIGGIYSLKRSDDDIRLLDIDMPVNITYNLTIGDRLLVNTSVPKTGYVATINGSVAISKNIDIDRYASIGEKPAFFFPINPSTSQTLLIGGRQTGGGSYNGLFIVPNLDSTHNPITGGAGLGGFNILTGRNWTRTTISGLNFAPSATFVSIGQGNSSGNLSVMGITTKAMISTTSTLLLGNLYGMRLGITQGTGSLWANKSYGIYIEDHASTFTNLVVNETKLLYIERPNKAKKNYQVFLNGTGNGTGIWIGDNATRIHAPDHDEVAIDSLIYGEMWMHNDTSAGAIEPIDTLGVWENITVFNQTSESGQTLNGMRFYQHHIIANYSGTYKVDYSVSFERISGGVAREYKFVVAVNGVEQENLETHRRTGNSNDVGNTGGTGLIQLVPGDEVHLWVQNTGGTEDVGIHAANINLWRIGK